MYNPKSLKAEEFIDHDEIMESIKYADENIKNNKDLIVSLCNFLYNIPLTDKEKKLFYKQLKKDKNLLKSFNISKKDFTEELFNSIFDALEAKNKINEI